MDEKKESRGSLAVERYLLSKGWSYRKECTYPDCTHKGTLRFDFFVPHLNLLIEFDGAQHFGPVAIFKGEEGFQDLIIRDSIKEQYCLQNGIQLLRVCRVEWVKEDLESLFGMNRKLVMMTDVSDKKSKIPVEKLMFVREPYFALSL